MMFACIRRSAIALATIGMSLTACQSYPSAPVPARMVSDKTTTQCLEQLQYAVQRPGSGHVVLTRAAFANDDRLTIVPSQSILDAAGQPAGGRILAGPDSFRLKLNNGVCTVLREADAQATPLSACTCVAIQ